MSEIKRDGYEPVTFDSIKIGLASPEKIREWSKGEVENLVEAEKYYEACPEGLWRVSCL